MLPHKIMIVDDNSEILKSFKRRYSKTFNVDTFDEVRLALDQIAKDDSYAAVVSDFRMPVMDGIEFLSRVKAQSPHTVRILLTGYADLKTSLDAVNKSNIFRMLTKPCPSQVMNNALADAVRQYQLLLAEQELLNKTLMGTVQVISEVLSIAKPDAFGRGMRIKKLAVEIAREMKVPELWEIEIAASLSQLGLLAFPDEFVRKVMDGIKLSDPEKKTWADHPRMAANLIRHIPRLEKVSEIVAFQEKPFGKSGVPDQSPGGEDIPLGARILKAAIDFDGLSRKESRRAAALSIMKATNEKYDSFVLKALEDIIHRESKGEIKQLSIKDLTEKMLVVEDIYSKGKKRKLISSGYELTLNIIDCLEKNPAE